MAAKMSVLLADVDGPMEVIEQGKYGFHFRSGKAHSLAEQIKQIIFL